MPGDGELPAEFQRPVAYAELWLWLALAAVVAVILFYAITWWATRAPRVKPLARRDVDLPDVRSRHLTAIDDIAEQVAAGDLSARAGHQQLSEVVRSYVAAITTLPARTMALADFRTHAPRELVDVIELLYPPEFAPAATQAERFDEAVEPSRDLVAHWAAEEPDTDREVADV